MKTEEEQSILDEKFLWLQVLHIVEDTLPTDNPATGHKTITKLFEQFNITKRDE